MQTVDTAAPPGLFVAAARFPCTREAVAEARKWITVTFAKIDFDPDDAQRVVSELAANAIEHAQTGFRITVTYTGSNLVRITVSDYSSALPVIPEQPGLFDEGGRGLFIVRALSEHYECRLAEGCPGKAIAVDLRGVSRAA